MVTDYKQILNKLDQLKPVQYAKNRNFIDGSVSMLSPYISRGVLSTKQVLEHLQKKGFEAKKIEKFIQELAWRDYWQLIWKEKDINVDNIHGYAPIEMVKQNFKNNTSDINDLFLVKGKVEDTLKIPSNIPEKISILRLDTDWYESTKIELEVLYPRLVKNGVLIIDDYGEWSGSRKATNEYFKDKKVAMFKIDRAARLIFKP